jgi:hypothetical protein
LATLEKAQKNKRIFVKVAISTRLATLSKLGTSQGTRFFAIQRIEKTDPKAGAAQHFDCYS